MRTLRWKYGSLFQLRRPVEHQRHGFVAFFFVTAVDEELLAICRSVESSSLSLGRESLKERMGNAKADCVAGRI